MLNLSLSNNVSDEGYLSMIKNKTKTEIRRGRNYFFKAL